MRIDRVGDVVSASGSFDAFEWTPIGDPQTLPGLPETALVGVVAVGLDREVPTITFEPLQAVVERPRFDTTRFLRGDCNDDGAIDISDSVCILDWLFLGSEAPGCIAALDTNGDENVDIADPMYSLGFSFLGGPAPVPPYPDCGLGTLPTDQSTCETPPKRCQP